MLEQNDDVCPSCKQILDVCPTCGQSIRKRKMRPWIYRADGGLKVANDERDYGTWIFR